MYWSRGIVMITKSRLFKKNSTRKSMQRYAQEVCGVVIGAGVLYAFISLLSYHPTDQSLIFYASDEQLCSNWGGVVGAWIAALAFYLVGIAAYAVWGIAVLCAVLVFLGKPVRLVLLRMVSFATASFALAALCTLTASDLGGQISGGLLGHVLARYMQFFFGYQGALILLGACVWIGLLYAIQISFFDYVWYIVYKMISWGMIPLYWASMLCRKAVQRMWITAKGFCTRKKNIIQEVFSPAHTLAQDIIPQKAHVLVEDFDQQIFEHETPTQDIFSAVHDLHVVTPRCESTVVRVGKYCLKRLPNSVLQVNIFSLRLSNGFLWHDLLSQAQQEIGDNFILPDVHQFTQKPVTRDVQREQDLYLQRGKMLEEKLACFGLHGKVTAIHPGPVITLFEYKPDIDSKISKIIALEDDLAMVLTAHSIRIIAPIPGKDVVGFEIANQVRHEILIAQVICTPSFEDYSGHLPLVLGVDVLGNPVVQDLVSMPHLLVAGATGSGKSVGMNGMLTSLLCKKSPEQMKLILIDPKRLEFTPYADIPHLLFPIVTQPHKAAGVLKWLVQEMEERYQQMATIGVRSVLEYQKLAQQKHNLKPMPFIVVMIDELADLMMVAAKDVETQIIRLAQMARAAGIHLIIATQRPSVDVVTGLIKVNFPSRISFRVSSKVDSRTVLDASGAEKLLGRGDLLFMHASSPTLRRIHGAYLSDQEIEKLTDHLRAQAQPQYLDLHDELRRCVSTSVDEQEDELYESVIEFIKSIEEISISLLQRHYRIGFNRSARIIEKLELDGLIAPAQGSKPRKVLH